MRKEKLQVTISSFFHNVFDLAEFNPSSNDKILNWTKLKTFVDNKLDVARITISLYDVVENIVGKGENAGESIFSFSHYVFKRFFFFRFIQSRDSVVKS